MWHHWHAANAAPPPPPPAFHHYYRMGRRPSRLLWLLIGAGTAYVFMKKDRDRPLWCRSGGASCRVDWDTDGDAQAPARRWDADVREARHGARPARAAEEPPHGVPSTEPPLAESKSRSWNWTFGSPKTPAAPEPKAKEGSVQKSGEDAALEMTEYALESVASAIQALRARIDERKTQRGVPPSNQDPPKKGGVNITVSGPQEKQNRS